MINNPLRGKEKEDFKQLLKQPQQPKQFFPKEKIGKQPDLQFPIRSR